MSDEGKLSIQLWSCWASWAATAINDLRIKQSPNFCVHRCVWVFLHWNRHALVTVFIPLRKIKVSYVLWYVLRRLLKRLQCLCVCRETDTHSLFSCILTLLPGDWNTSASSVQASEEQRVQDMSLLVLCLLVGKSAMGRGTGQRTWPPRWTVGLCQAVVCLVVRTGMCRYWDQIPVAVFYKI